MSIGYCAYLLLDYFGEYVYRTEKTYSQFSLFSFTLYFPPCELQETLSFLQHAVVAVQNSLFLPLLKKT